MIVDREDSSPKQRSLEDHSLDNWVSDDEESLQMFKAHPEVIPDHHPDKLENWSDRVNAESDKDEISCSNHLSHSSSSTSSHMDLNDIMITVDSPTVDSTADNPAPIPNLV